MDLEAIYFDTFTSADINNQHTDDNIELAIFKTYLQHKSSYVLPYEMERYLRITKFTPVVRNSIFMRQCVFIQVDFER